MCVCVPLHNWRNHLVQFRPLWTGVTKTVIVRLGGGGGGGRGALCLNPEFVGLSEVAANGFKPPPTL